MKLVFPLLFLINFCKAAHNQKIQIFLPPEVRELRDIERESTFCTSVLVSEHPIYITRIVPRLSVDTNHISLVSVNDDGQEAKNLSQCATLKANMSDAWQSGSPNPDVQVQTLFVTGGQTAEPLNLPSGVAFEVRAPSKLILQVHFAPYRNYRKAMDNVGVTLFYTTAKQPLKAGILSVHAGGRIKSGSSLLKASCVMEQSLWPLFALGHTHDLGRQVSGWIQSNANWTKIAQINPQQPQLFRPIKNAVKLNRQEILEVRCAYDNPDSNSVFTGPNRQDEMCALYLLYCTPDEPLKNSYCIGGGNINSV